jgi:histo-blood group ABO system transferase
MKIGLLTIATGKYIQFVNPLWESVKKHFMKNHEVTMFVFTDSKDFIPEPGQIKIAQQHIPWPGPTLYRYNIFKNSENLIKEMDYLYYSDADMLFVNDVGDEILGDLVATQHPGFYNKPRELFTYETNPESKAFIPKDKGTKYFAGGFNGGKTLEYLKLITESAENIAHDARRGIIAVWHDESHMNRYFSVNEPTLILNPSYCYPESSNIPFERKLLALDKNHNEMRK